MELCLTLVAGYHLSVTADTIIIASEANCNLVQIQRKTVQAVSFSAEAHLVEFQLVDGICIVICNSVTQAAELIHDIMQRMTGKSDAGNPNLTTLEVLNKPEVLRTSKNHRLECPMDLEERIYAFESGLINAAFLAEIKSYAGQLNYPCEVYFQTIYHHDIIRLAIVLVDSGQHEIPQAVSRRYYIDYDCLGQPGRMEGPLNNSRKILHVKDDSSLS